MADSFLIWFLIVLPLIGSLFVLSAKDDAPFYQNTLNVSLLTLTVNVCLVLIAFSKLSLIPSHEIIVTWTFLPSLNLSFGADVMSLIFILGLQISILIGILGIKAEQTSSKNLLFHTLLYTSILNGYFLARDILSFYVCFAGMLWPFYMLTLAGISDVKYKILERVMMHYFLSAALFLASLMMIVSLTQNNVLIFNLPEVIFSHKKSMIVWGALFMALVLRVPVWPFHHAIITLSNSLKNPLVFIALHILPLSGIYAFMRFWPLDIPYEIEVLSPLFQGLCILTMIFAAFGGYAHSGAGQKLYHYIFVYDLLYLSAVFLPTDAISFNITYSIFSFMLISSGLVMLQAHMLTESSKFNIGVKGILCYMPRTSLAYALFVLAAIGLPISAFFSNNFIIVSQMFDFGLYIGTLVVISITIASVSMLENLYTLRVENCILPQPDTIKDITPSKFAILVALMMILLFSLIKPLWFVL